MANQVQAVLAALRAVLKDATRSHVIWWDADFANRWLDQLPGPRSRWASLELRGYENGHVTRAEMVCHLRAMVAFLEKYKEDRKHPNSRLPAPSSLPGADAPIDAEYQEVEEEEGFESPPPRLKILRLFRS